MKAILKSTTNEQILSEIGKKFMFYNKPIKKQPFTCHGIDTQVIFFSSTVTFVGNVGNMLRVATNNSEYIFEVIA